MCCLHFPGDIIVFPSLKTIWENTKNYSESLYRNILNLKHFVTPEKTIKKNRKKRIFLYSSFFCLLAASLRNNGFHAPTSKLNLRLWEFWIPDQHSSHIEVPSSCQVDPRHVSYFEKLVPAFDRPSQSVKYYQKVQTS